MEETNQKLISYETAEETWESGPRDEEFVPYGEPVSLDSESSKSGSSHNKIDDGEDVAAMSLLSKRPHRC